MVHTMIMSTFCYRNRFYWFRKPIMFTITKEGEFFNLSSNVCSMKSQSKTIKEAVLNAYIGFHYLWCNIVERSDDLLDEKDKQVKGLLCDIVDIAQSIL